MQDFFHQQDHKISQFLCWTQLPTKRWGQRERIDDGYIPSCISSQFAPYYCLLILVPGIDGLWRILGISVIISVHQPTLTFNIRPEPRSETAWGQNWLHLKGNICFRRQILVRFKWNSMKGPTFWFWSSVYHWNRKVEGKFRILEHHQNRFCLFSSAPLRFWTYHPISIRVELSVLKSN